MSTALFSRLSSRGQVFAAHCGFEAALMVVSSASGVQAMQIRAGVDANRVRHRDPAAVEISEARQEAIYLAAVRFGISLRKIAQSLGVSHEAVRKAIRAVEDRRDRDDCDRRLDELEIELMGAA